MRTGRMTREELIKRVDDSISILDEMCKEIKAAEDEGRIHEITTDGIINYYSKSADLLRSYPFSSQEEFDEIRIGKERQLLDALVKVTQVNSLRLQELSGESSSKEVNEAYRRIDKQPSSKTH